MSKMATEFKVGERVKFKKPFPSNKPAVIYTVIRIWTDNKGESAYRIFSDSGLNAFPSGKYLEKAQ